MVENSSGHLLFISYSTICFWIDKNACVNTQKSRKYDEGGMSFQLSPKINRILITRLIFIRQQFTTPDLNIELSDHWSNHFFWWSFLINSYNLNPSCQSRQPIRTHNLIAHSQIQPYQHSQSNCLKCLKIDFRFFTYPRWRFFPCWWVWFAICILKIISVNICTYMPCKNILVLEFHFIAPIWLPSMLQFFILLHLQLIKLSHVLTFNYRCKGNWTWDPIFFKMVSLAITLLLSSHYM